MTQPSFACPRCGYTTFLPSDVNAGYCPQCRYWTGDSLLGSEDVLAQAEIDGPFAMAGLLPRHQPPWPYQFEIPPPERPLCRVCGEPAAIAICAWHQLEPVGYACEEHGEIEGDGTGDALPEIPDLDPAFADLVSAGSSHCPDWQIRVLRAQRERSLATRADLETHWFGAPIIRDAEPTFRVARFVQALRRFRRG